MRSSYLQILLLLLLGSALVHAGEVIDFHTKKRSCASTLALRESNHRLYKFALNAGLNQAVARDFDIKIKKYNDRERIDKLTMLIKDNAVLAKSLNKPPLARRVQAYIANDMYDSIADIPLLGPLDRRHRRLTRTRFDAAIRSEQKLGHILLVAARYLSVPGNQEKVSDLFVLVESLQFALQSVSDSRNIEYFANTKLQLISELAPFADRSTGLVSLLDTLAKQGGADSVSGRTAIDVAFATVYYLNEIKVIFTYARTPTIAAIKSEIKTLLKQMTVAINKNPTADVYKIIRQFVERSYDDFMPSYLHQNFFEAWPAGGSSRAAASILTSLRLAIDQISKL